MQGCEAATRLGNGDGHSLVNLTKIMFIRASVRVSNLNSLCEKSFFEQLGQLLLGFNLSKTDNGVDGGECIKVAPLLHQESNLSTAVNTCSVGCHGA